MRPYFDSTARPGHLNTPSAKSRGHCEPPADATGHRTLLPASLIFVAATLLATNLAASATAKLIQRWDFTTTDTLDWAANARAEISPTDKGLQIQATGPDPWIEGPPLDLPKDKIIKVTIRMKSYADPAAELFYGPIFRADSSVPFTAKPDGNWHDYNLFIREPLGANTRFRLDPSAGPGRTVVASVEVHALPKPASPPLQKPAPIRENTADWPVVESGPVKIAQSPNNLGAFELTVQGKQMAVGHNDEYIGLLLRERTEWLSLKSAPVTVHADPAQNNLKITARTKDSRGASWQIERTIKPANVPGTIAIRTQLRTDTDRHIVRLPWLTVFPGLGTFGTEKQQAVFPGLEYLADEPSSSEIDLVPPHNIRRTPDPTKVTFPLMALSHHGCYLGLIWQASPMLQPTFDSPDTIYNSGAHLMALSAPAVGDLRFENENTAHSLFTITAGKPLSTTILVIAGKGKTVAPAVRHYLDLKPLPALPSLRPDFSEAVDLLAHGWLDSQIRSDGLFRHAIWQDKFSFHPAADAAMYIDSLAGQTKDQKLKLRLQTARDRALEKIPPGRPFTSVVSHVISPAPPLVFGRLTDYIRYRHNRASRLLQNFDPNGIKHYRPGQTDYSKGHFTDHANGYAAAELAEILEAATLAADPQLTDKALTLLDKQTALYAHTVPRGAQTWEICLHTPDILASAHLIRAYLFGYIISGKDEYLEQARYWAWTGLPFVYLHKPTENTIGTYATIAVFGATNWQAPVWLGQPVQWCGLVYASALNMLAEYDPAGPWKKIAAGITITGLQMSWPRTDTTRQGLLPDIFQLKTQHRAGPAINPGTVQAGLADAYNKGKLYHLKKARPAACFIHAPCAITDLTSDKNTIAFATDTWPDTRYLLLVSGLKNSPAKVEVHPTHSSATYHNYDPQTRSLILNLHGKCRVLIQKQ